MIEIEFIDKTAKNGRRDVLKLRLSVTQPWFAKKFRAVVENLPESDQKIISKLTTLTVVLVGTAESQQLNKTHRKKNYATDILSFAPVEKGSLGELVFCSPIIKSQAKEHALTEQRELLYLFIHGVLHLLGYDHEKSDKDAGLMYRLQDRIFAKLRR